MASKEDKLILYSRDYLRLLEPGLFEIIFNNFFKITLPNINEKPIIEKKKIIPCGEIDVYISYKDMHGIAVEIKDEWKPSPGQLEQYYKYARENNENAFLILLSPNPLEYENKHIQNLFQANDNWRHRTWKHFYNYAINSDIISDSFKTSELKGYLEDKKKKLLEEKRRKTEYSRVVELPELCAINAGSLNHKPLADNRSFAAWESGDEFWTDIIESIVKSTGHNKFYTNTFDLYHYIFTWSYYNKNVYFEIRKDNKWEYYIDYFMKYLEKDVGEMKCENPTMEQLYNKYLKISVGNVVKCGNWYIGMINVDGKQCYFVTPELKENLELKRVKCWELEELDRK